MMYALTKIEPINLRKCIIQLFNYFKSLMNYKFVDTHTVPFCRQVDNESHFLIQGILILPHHRGDLGCLMGRQELYSLSTTNDRGRNPVMVSWHFNFKIKGNFPF